MSDTRVLLARIAALRKRLDESIVPPDAPATFAEAVRRSEDGAAHDAAVDAAVSSATAATEEAPAPRPRQLTARARRVLERGRDLLGKLRGLADAFPFLSTNDDPCTDGVFDRNHPLSILYRETAAMTDSSLRLVALFPDTATAQMRLCEGVEAILDAVGRRTRTLGAGVDNRRAEAARVARFAALLADLDTGRPVGLDSFEAIAAEILADVDECVPVRFLDFDPAHPERSVARHGLTVARVAARLVRHNTEAPARPLDTVLAALLHDVGRRTVEGHCRAGAEMLTALAPEERWLADCALCHHESMDGTGYPGGLREQQISPLTRFVAVCDVYTALCTARPHRPAREPRTAMADTLLLAEQGRLDGGQAERLLRLSFYPTGSAVELADGSLAVVVAAPAGADPARPVVALLIDGRGEPQPFPRHLDLAACGSHSIIRTLPAAERSTALGRKFPEWQAA